MECGPGSVTGCSAVNNDLVVCAAQECSNVWEYSTQSEGGSEGGRGRAREPRPDPQKARPVCLRSKERDKFTLSLLLSSFRKKTIISFKGISTKRCGDGCNPAAAETDRDSKARKINGCQCRTL